MDIKLHFTEKGAGEPLILLHGNGESGEYFIHQIGYFSSKYRVIAVDTRGHGRSPRGSAAFTIRQFAEDLRCFMDEQEMKEANLLGFSDGGNIALMFALKYPERVKRCLLYTSYSYIGYRLGTHAEKRAVFRSLMLFLVVDRRCSLWLCVIALRENARRTYSHLL